MGGMIKKGAFLLVLLFSIWLGGSLAVNSVYDQAVDIATDIANFTHVLNASDTTVQKALDKIDSKLVDSAADNVTKGIAAFNASDFNSASGIIALDYPNGLTATASRHGFLSDTDWNNFNNKSVYTNFSSMEVADIVWMYNFTANKFIVSSAGGEAGYYMMMGLNNYSTTLQAGNATANNTFIMPLTMPNSEQVLVCDAGGNWSWASAFNLTSLTLSGDITAENLTLTGNPIPLTIVGSWDDATFANNTVEARTTGGTVFTLRYNATTRYTALGYNTTWNETYFDIATAGSAATLNFWYWNGTAWNQTTITDGTTGFTADGAIKFTMPTDWYNNGTVNSTTGIYWLLINSTAGSYATNATCYYIVPYANTNDLVNMTMIGGNPYSSFKIDKFGKVYFQDARSAVTSIQIGDDVNMYRSAANVLTIPGGLAGLTSLAVAGNANITGSITSVGNAYKIFKGQPAVLQLGTQTNISYSSLYFSEQNSTSAAEVSAGAFQLIGALYSAAPRRGDFEFINFRNYNMSFWTNNLVRWEILGNGTLVGGDDGIGNNPIVVGNITGIGYTYLGVPPTSIPPTANSTMFFYLNETTGQIVFQVKNSTGVVQNATLTLTP